MTLEALNDGRGGPNVNERTSGVRAGCWGSVVTVGAGLLAKSVDQPAPMLNMPTSSRASSHQLVIRCSAVGLQLISITRRRRSRFIGQRKNTLIQIRPDIRPFPAIGDKPSQLLARIHDVRFMGHQHDPGD